MSECLQIMGLKSKYDRNPSFIVRSRNNYKIAKQVRSECEFLWCHYFSFWCLLSMLRSIYFDTLIGTTFLHVYRFRRYDWSCLFEPTLRSVWLIWTDVTIGVLDFNRRYDRCTRLQPTIGVIDLLLCYGRYDRYSHYLAPFYPLMLIVRSNSRMLVVIIH